jgi:hypothetical protein
LLYKYLLNILFIFIIQSLFSLEIIDINKIDSNNLVLRTNDVSSNFSKQNIILKEFSKDNSSDFIIDSISAKNYTLSITSKVFFKENVHYFILLKDVSNEIKTFEFFFVNIKNIKFAIFDCSYLKSYLNYNFNRLYIKPITKNSLKYYLYNDFYFTIFQPKYNLMDIIDSGFSNDLFYLKIKIKRTPCTGSIFNDIIQYDFNKLFILIKRKVEEEFLIYHSND